MTVSARAGGPVPMAYFDIGFNDRGTLFDTDPVRNQLSLDRLAPFLIVFTMTNTQVLHK